MGGWESVVNVVLLQRVGARREVVLAAAEVLGLAVRCLDRGGDEAARSSGVTEPRAWSSFAAQQHLEGVIGLHRVDRKSTRLLPGVVGVAPGPVGDVEDGNAESPCAGGFRDQQPCGEAAITVGVAQMVLAARRVQQCGDRSLAPVVLLVPPAHQTAASIQPSTVS